MPFTPPSIFSIMASVHEALIFVSPSCYDCHRITSVTGSCRCWSLRSYHTQRCNLGFLYCSVLQFSRRSVRPMNPTAGLWLRYGQSYNAPVANSWSFHRSAWRVFRESEYWIKARGAPHYSQDQSRKIVAHPSDINLPEPEYSQGYNQACNFFSKRLSHSGFS